MAGTTAEAGSANTYAADDDDDETLQDGLMRLPIRSVPDLVEARRRLEGLAAGHGFTIDDALVLKTALGELARNILSHAGSGEVLLERLTQGPSRGIRITARDEGPGIRDVDQALTAGVGLSAVARLMDEFRVESTPGAGTTLTSTKWTGLRPATHRAA